MYYFCMKRAEHIDQFVSEIWQWYQHHKRTLPWRDLQIEDDTQRAYQVLVSEVMLQQTQVLRVIIKYKEFLNTFPTLRDLVKASNKDVILAWRGLGYNSRALRLRDAAQIIQKQYGGEFPKEMSELLSIKGIGEYTAAAIRNFAFNLPTPCLDTNIRRILHRAFVGPENADGTWPKDDRYLLGLAEKILTEVQCRGISTADWHAALMDFGSLVCTKRSPKWDICPLTKRGLMKAAYRVPEPVKKSATKEPGRYVGSVYIPNRIFRGKIVEELRDAPGGLTLGEIGSRVCMDWTLEQHKEWLQKVVESLIRDQLVTQTKRQYVLVD